MLKSDHLLSPDVSVRRAPTIALLCCVLAGCGEAGRTTPRISQSPGHSRIGASVTGDYDTDDYNVAHYGDGDNDDNHKPKDRDNDTDNSSGSYYDLDDNVVRHYGRAAGVSDRRAITTVVKDYYAATVALDGASACSMIMPSIARAIPGSLGRSPGPVALRGRTCSEVMGKVFKQNYRQLSTYTASLKVSSVGIEGDRALAVLSFRALPGRQIRLIRIGAAWKLEALLDSELP